jgi:L-seryl-tRNA(Ser) seleniumtransferase
MNSEEKNTAFRNLPSVDSILNSKHLNDLGYDDGAFFMTEIIREVLLEAREAISNNQEVSSEDDLILKSRNRILSILQPRPRKVINAGGVVINTNLGRSPLSEKAQQAVLDVSGGYSDLEYDLVAGERGSRHSHPEKLLRFLSGGESAVVVNNNASALLLSLSALANGKEVIVSRGESIEIGGRFRIPDVLNQSGAIIVEVGTTNRTYVEDYENAITENTAAILKVHRSNFEIIGFTHTPEEKDLAKLCNQFSIPLINDLGSGCLIQTTKYGLDPEPTVREAIDTGAALALFSGDKLLGGPQAGIIVGKKHYIETLKSHPLARAVRIDKLDLAALTATLIPYLTGDFETEVPIWRMISASMKSLDSRAKSWAKSIGSSKVQVIDGQTAVGGGSLPGQMLDTKNLMIPKELCGPGGADKLAENLRTSKIPIITRVSEDNLLLDVRTVLPEQDVDLCNTLSNILN